MHQTLSKGLRLVTEINTSDSGVQVTNFSTGYFSCCLFLRLFDWLGYFDWFDMLLG